MGDLLDDYDATGLAELVAQGDVSPSELVDASIARIETFDPKINAVIHRQFDRARREAAATLPEGPFTGVPFLFKDLGCEEAGEPHHQGMRALREAAWRSPHDSPLALRFRALGFIPIGRTNTPELALMGTTEPESYGPTHNPWDLTRSPGGSSGGSGAAVAAGFVPSRARQRHRGIDTHPRVPVRRSRTEAESGTHDPEPRRGRGSDDAERGLDHPHDARHRSRARRSRRLDLVTPRRRGRDRIRGAFASACACTRSPAWTSDEGCVEAARGAARLMETLGHVVEEAWPAALYDPDLLPGATSLAAAHSAVALDEWSAVLGRELGEDDIEPASWSLISRGRSLTGADVMRALQRQEELTRQIRAWWRGPDRDGFDLLLTPTTAEPGPPLGAYKQGFAPGRGSAFTRVFNATGQPALSLPLGWPDDGLPRGVQLVAAYGRDDVLIRVGSQLEEAAPWFDRRPPLG